MPIAPQADACATAVRESSRRSRDDLVVFDRETPDVVLGRVFVSVNCGAIETEDVFRIFIGEAAKRDFADLEFARIAIWRDFTCSSPFKNRRGIPLFPSDTHLDAGDIILDRRQTLSAQLRLPAIND